MPTFAESIDAFKRALLVQHLIAADWNHAAAARALAMSDQLLRYYVRKFSIQKEDYR